MEFLGSGMMTALGCGCCCLAVVVVVGIAGLLGTRRKRAAPAVVSGGGAAPLRGSATTARLTMMEEAQEAEVPRRGPHGHGTARLQHEGIERRVFIFSVPPQFDLCTDG